MTITGLTHASQNALEGIDRAVHRVEDVARQVASGQADRAGDSSFTRQFEALVHLINARQQVRSNAEVVDTVDSLMRTLSGLPRR